MLDLCKRCEIKQADIFHDDGNYCCECWQELTHTEVSVTESITNILDMQFQHCLSAAHLAISEPAELSQLPNNKNKPRLMVVDDDDDILTTYKMFLSNSGYYVDTFNDAEHALAAFAKSSQYALVVLDIRMPKINGLQLFQRMKGINSRTNIIFITALDACDELKTLLPYSARVMKKPVEKAKFISEVDSLISVA